jgi:hypothetical protein
VLILRCIEVRNAFTWACEPTPEGHGNQVCCLVMHGDKLLGSSCDSTTSTWAKQPAARSARVFITRGALAHSACTGPGSEVHLPEAKKNGGPVVFNLQTGSGSNWRLLLPT